MANVIGVMRMIENNEADDKIIAVAADDTSVAHIHNITELPRHVTSELKHFFEEYKRLENTTVRIDESQDADNAKQIIPQAEHDYQQVHNGIV